MDRSRTQTALSESAMRLGGVASVELLPGAPALGKRGQLRLDEADRPLVSETAFLRFSPNHRLAHRLGLGGQREAGGAINAGDGDPLHLARAEHQPPTPGPHQIPVPVARPCNMGSESGLVCGHHLYSLAAGLSISGGDHGLVQPICAGLGVIKFHGNDVLSSDVESGADAGDPSDLEYRSRGPVHQRSVYRAAEGGRDRHQHGWPGPGTGQRFYRTALVVRQIRGGVSFGLCRRTCRVPASGEILSVLQQRTAAPGVGPENPPGSVFKPPHGGPGAPDDRGGTPNPQSRKLKRMSPPLSDPPTSYKAHSRIGEGGAHPRPPHPRKETEKRRWTT